VDASSPSSSPGLSCCAQTTLGRDPQEIPANYPRSGYPDRRLFYLRLLVALFSVCLFAGSCRQATKLRSSNEDAATECCIGRQQADADPRSPTTSATTAAPLLDPIQVKAVAGFSKHYRWGSESACWTGCKPLGGRCSRNDADFVCLIPCKRDSDCPKPMAACWCEGQGCSFFLFSPALPPGAPNVCVEEFLSIPKGLLPERRDAGVQTR
jgi:hypothetical protein